MNTELHTYIANARVEGVREENIEKALFERGWKAEDVYAALRVANDPCAPDAERAWEYLRFGFLCFSVASGFLLYLFFFHKNFEFGVREVHQATYALFVLTHILNSVAFFYAFRAIWHLRTSMLYKIFIGMCAVAVPLFGLLSLLHLLPAAMGIEDYPYELFADEGTHLIVTYWILLPLQTIVYILLLVVLGILYLRRHHFGVSPPKKLFAVLLTFLFMAILAIGDMFMGMDVFDNF